MFFIIGFLCGRLYQKGKWKTQTSSSPGTASQSDQGNIPNTHTSTPYYDDVVLKQCEQELELKENIAYAPVQ